MKKFLVWFFGLALVLVLAVGGGAFYIVKQLDLSEGERQLPVPSISSLRQTGAGPVIGFVDQHDAHAWLGIPYATPPVGDRRWQAPQPPLPMAKRLEALSPGARCPQFQGDLSGDEDCLYLNIWAPGLVSELIPDGLDRWPVMFWIHGGGNSVGEGASAMYNGALMATEHKVIVVSINYRLGPLGWFTHPSLRNTAQSLEDASGNFGTLDIVAALEWVKGNISNFGGDPGNVTIYGESAGGVDVLTMMATPYATGLFHRAIVQSGGYSPQSISNAENFVEDGGHRLSSMEIVSKLLIADGKATDSESARTAQASMSDQDMARYLRGQPVASFFAAYRSGGGSFGMIGNPDVFADGAVLPDMDAATLFSDPANYNAVPLIIGTNRDETKLFQFMSESQVKRAFGLPYQVIDKVAYERAARYGSDMWKARSVDTIAAAIAATDAPPVFAYRFDVDDLRNLGFIDLKEVLGAAHAMEIPFVFGNFGGVLGFVHPDSLSDERMLLSSTMMSYWAEFAYSGRPGDGRLHELATWRPWRNAAGADRILLLDYETDGGVRMSNLSVTVDDVKARFLADASFNSDVEFCSMYKSVFNEAPTVARCL